MPFVLTTNAVITCPHGGVVSLIPKQQVVSIQGGFVVCFGDLVGSPIAGCPQAGPGIKPCTTVLAVPGSIAPKVLVGGKPVHVQMPMPATTDGVPPGMMLLVSFAGQSLVQA